MPVAMTFRDIISGRRRGVRATAARSVLAFAEVFYGWAVRWRNARYDRRDSAVERVDVPVISVGNLTTGGTGKTPMVAWIARWYGERGRQVTLISRGYGAEAGSRNDEALELELRLPGVPHLQNPDRVVAARTAIEKYDCQLIVLDDAFQHRRIHRDLDIVLIDALEPFGYEHLLPRGLLREPISSLRRAQVIALSRADLITPEQRAALRFRVAHWAPAAAWVEVAHRPRGIVSAAGESADLNSLRGQRAAAFCGIGNPLGFRRTLENSGVEIVSLREFPDHHPYSAEDVSALKAWIDSLDVTLVLCTLKDFVKLRVDRLGSHPLRALAIDVEVLSGCDELESQLAALTPREGAV